MARTIQADGRTVQVPDDATPEEVNQIFGPPPAPVKGVGGGLRPLTEQEELQTTFPVGAKGEGVGENLHNMARNAFTGAYGVIRHPINTLTGLVKSVMPGNDTPNPIQSLYQGLNTRPGETLSTMAGQTAVLGPASKIAAKTVPAAIYATGGGLKAAGGRLADLTAVGSNALDRQFGAKPGRALSENRIVGISKAGLKSKVDAAIPKLADERTALLQKSTAGPQNIRPEVDQPFADLTSKVTGKTGVASPAEIASLTRTRVAAGFEQDPFTGKPLQDPITHAPVPRDLEHMTPAEIASFNSNLRTMGNYEAKTSPLADQAVKQAGHNLRGKLADVAPESVDLTRQMYNAETASDVLRRGLPSEGAPNMSPYAVYNPKYGIVANTVGGVTRGVGTTAAAGLDLLGSGMKKIAGAMRPNPPGPPPAGSSKPPQPQLPSQSAVPSGPFVTPPPTPTPPQIPAAAGPTSTPGVPPPNVSLTERVAPRPNELLTQSPARPGQPSPAPGTGGLMGPGGRVTTRTPTGFGPKREAPNFTIPKRQLTSGKEGDGNAIQEPSTGGVLPHSSEGAGGQGGGRPGVGPSLKGKVAAGKSVASQIAEDGGGADKTEGQTLKGKVIGRNKEGKK